ncbi:hypothetical protein EI94DRAFT_1281736 [Lactarius quietus]|nr:hypothetical protein EI94DRAFT_1281736 [Lactarius quietus]
MEFVSSEQPLFHSEEDRENASLQNTRIKPSLVLSPTPWSAHPSFLALRPSSRPPPPRHFPVTYLALPGPPIVRLPLLSLALFGHATLPFPFSSRLPFSVLSSLRPLLCSP